jgi:hypothetical protein
MEAVTEVGRAEIAASMAAVDGLVLSAGAEAAPTQNTGISR